MPLRIEGYIKLDRLRTSLLHNPGLQYPIFIDIIIYYFMASDILFITRVLVSFHRQANEITTRASKFVIVHAAISSVTE